LRANHFGDKQSPVVLKESLVLARRPKTEILLIADLHGMSGCQLRTGIPQVAERVVKHVKVSLSLVMPCGMRCEIRQSKQRCAVGAHPDARNALDLILHEAAIKYRERECAQE